MSKKSKSIKHPDGIEVYDAADGLRWRAWSKGRIVADSGQGYSRRIDLEAGMCAANNAIIDHWWTSSPPISKAKIGRIKRK